MGVAQAFPQLRMGVHTQIRRPAESQERRPTPHRVPGATPILPPAVWLKKACPTVHHFHQTSVVGESGNGKIPEPECETEQVIFVLTEAIAQLTNESETEQLMLALTKESAQIITAVVIIRNNVW